MSTLIENLGGQWLSSFDGVQSGHGLLSFNTFGNSGGYVSLYQNENSAEKTPTLLLQGRVSVSSVSQTSFAATAKQNNSQTLNEVVINGERSSNSEAYRWNGTWSSTPGYCGTFEMVKVRPLALEAQEVSEIKSWNDFSDWAFNQRPEVSVFRGVGDKDFSLVSTAHRSGIFDLHHYLVETLPRVRAELVKRHGLSINLSAPDGLAEMLALIRHHGFPTPVMDWSKSPWVALYFALTSAKLITTTRKYCRVYCLRHNGISVVANVMQSLLAPSLSGSLAEIPTPMTSRVTAQEGVFLLTPCVDVMSSLIIEGKHRSQQMIGAIDIKADLAEEFLNRLDRMMINEATMLSSIDSTLRHLRARLIG